MANHLHQRFPVGAVVKLAKPCMGNPAGSLAFVYENYRLGASRQGISLLFANGKYDGFGPECVALFGLTLVRIESTLQDYQFSNVGQLDIDRQRKVFAPAFA
ncbi:hypothetical protein IC617_08440 [Neiella sp. HB171785]|uniref:Uncharacterized protein n=1 Tax=Neiella litorisoli TaxID=2771431 RepID=A0A8J6QIP8_9GAMM|nr:hypothetical protein [Neiella litorisoli]MBD1389453.1 hypothetical protein [Neiella litorisoli]